MTGTRDAEPPTQTEEVTVSDQVLAKIGGALDLLAERLQLEELTGPGSHTPLQVDGLSDPDVAKALAMYLVGCIAGAVDVDARLSGAMLATGREAMPEVKDAVERLVGPDNVWNTPAATNFRDTQRNAWIAEGFAHALLVIRGQRSTPLLPGPVLAIVPLHTIPSESGLDAVALYVDGQELVVAVGESKASRLYGSQMLTDAAGMYARIDQNKYGVELRVALASFRRAVAPQVRERISDSLWREFRCYLPTILHELEFDPLTTRPTLARLAPSVARRRLGSVHIEGFHDFFDRVADEMRRIVLEEWA